MLGNTKREASAPEVKGLRDENERLKHALAETVLEESAAEKSVLGSDSDDQSACLLVRTTRAARRSSA